MRRVRHGYKKSSISIQMILVLTQTVIKVMWYNLSYCHLITSEELSVSWQFSKTYGLISHSSGWKKDVVNHLFPVLKGNWSEGASWNLSIAMERKKLKQFFTQFMAATCEMDVWKLHKTTVNAVILCPIMSWMRLECVAKVWPFSAVKSEATLLHPEDLKYQSKSSAACMSIQWSVQVEISTCFQSNLCLRFGSLDGGSVVSEGPSGLQCQSPILSTKEASSV